MTKSKLFSAAAIAALMVAAPVYADKHDDDDKDDHAQSIELRPFYGRISPFYGRISPFEGDIDPFWGRIQPFEDGTIAPYWGRISPFEGDIESFWGRISPFEDGDVEPFWGRISPFWGRISPFMGDLQANWGRISPFDDSDPDAHVALLEQFRQLVSESEAFWGERVTAATGDTFWEGFAAELFADFGIDLDDPSSLDNFSAADRAAFQFAWYDGLMSFSGMDHVDHWMETANWTPALTQVQGMGSDTTIGLIDFALTGDADLNDNLILWSGSQDASGGHGGAVASLLVADHDGQGLMGIAPDARVALFNPFDEDGTANWDKVTEGIVKVRWAGASVVNLSLGVPGATFDDGWAEVYDDERLEEALSKTVFVHAAGNDGHVQVDNIAWDVDADPTLIIVGSVGPGRNISGFSNRPGDACFVDDDGRCLGSLKDRFLVAPGEWILVTDGQGGVTRASGTSFAAPFVTGAIALMHDRWGWLKAYPEETADILFQTADDLGAPGVDAVYGHGLLNITASQSPLDYNKLYQLAVGEKERTYRYYLSDLDSKHVGSLLGAESGYIAVLEDVGNTYRDFLIPLDELLSGIGSTFDGSEEQLQTYLAASFAGLGDIGTSDKGKKEKDKDEEDDDFAFGSARVSLESFPLPFSEHGRADGFNVATELALSSAEGITLAFGNGVGAMSLTGDAAMATSRFDPTHGGVNPVLGLASGGGYARVDLPVFGSATLSVGATERSFDESYIDPISGELTLVAPELDTLEAVATHVSLTQPLGETVAFTAGYTQLLEANSALGVRSTLNSAFASGTRTDAANLGLQWTLNDRVSLNGSMTLGQTQSRDNANAIAIQENGLGTSAYELALSVNGVFNDTDQARLALVQPMFVESGQLTISSQEIVDRTTGELGFVSRNVDLTGARRLALETSWATPLWHEQAALGGFVRLESDMTSNARVDTLAGLQLQVQY